MSAEALQKRIKTTQELRDIVNNMKMLSSVSIWQYERANKALDKYRRNLRNAFHALMLHGMEPQSVTDGNGVARYLYILIGTDNGMVGKFNKEIIEKVRADMRARKQQRKDVLFLVIGKRLAALAEQAGLNVYYAAGISNSVKIVGSMSESILLKIDEAVLREHINHVVVYSHRRVGNTSVVLDSRQIMPYDKDMWKNLREKKWDTNNFPMISSDKKRLFSALIKEGLLIAMIRLLNSSLAAEHYTRMTNMQEAEKNIDANLELMNLAYQQQRQENITDELIDIISGAEAMA